MVKKFYIFIEYGRNPNFLLKYSDSLSKKVSNISSDNKRILNPYFDYKETKSIQ